MTHGTYKAQLIQIGTVLLLAGLVLGFGLALISGVGSGQSYENETAVENATVSVTDPANETVWSDVEFADNGSADRNVTVSFTYNGSELVNETVDVDPGNVTEVEFNASQSGEHNLTLYGNSSDVATFTAGVSTADDGSTDGGGLLPESDRDLGVLLIVGALAVFVVIIGLYGAAREVMR